MMSRRAVVSFVTSVVTVFCVATFAATDSAAAISTGFAKVDVTPTRPVILAGYGARTQESEGVDTRLFARAMVLGQEKPVAIVVLDNCGVPDNIRAEVVERLKPHGISEQRLVIAVTHTHNAPSLPGYASILWSGRVSQAQQQRAAEYAAFAVDKMVEAILAAKSSREPMELSYAQGRATFGGNRRMLVDGRWGGFGFQRNSPVDHRLPILVAKDADGHVRGIWANYACHCTAAGSVNRIGGDWAGFANVVIERAFPQCVSLMSIGCGADVGPQPTGALDIAKSHGDEIAASVKAALDDDPQPLRSPPRVVSERLRLPLEHAQDEQHPVRRRSYWQAKLQHADPFHRELAKSMLAKLDRAGAIPTHVDYAITTWTFEDQLAIVFLPGEVVVDYAVRLGQELDWSRLWLTAWANDMPGYIPSRRVLLEGGYEADFSQVYYDQPTRYALDVEDIVVNGVKRIVGDEFKATFNQASAPFHKLPNGEQKAKAD